MIKTLRGANGVSHSFLFIFLFTIISSQAFSQAVGDYRSQATGNWMTRATWQIWNGATWATPSAVQGYPGQFNSTANVTIWNANSVTYNVNIVISIPSLQIGSTTDATSGALVFNNNRLLTVAGTVTIGNSGTSSSGSIDMTNGGTLSINSLAVSNATGSSFTPGTGAQVDTVQFNATNTLPAAVFTSFNNIAFTGGITTAATALTIGGSVIINSGASFDGSSYTHTVGGNWVNNGGTFIPSTSTIDFNSSTANQTINGTVANQSFNNVIVDKAGWALSINITSTTTVTIGGSLAVTNGTFTIPAITFSVGGATNISGTLTISNATGTKTFTGLVTVNLGGTWNNSGSASFDIQGGITNNGTFTSGGAAAIYTFDTNDQGLTGTFSIRNVTVTGINLTNNTTLTVVTALSGTGTLTQAASATLNIGGTSAITSLVATANLNTVNFTAAAQTINANNYYNLTLSGSGTAIMQTGTTAIGGDFTTSGTVKTTTADNLTVSGNLSVGDGTILTLGGFNFTVNGTTTIGTGTSGKIAVSSTTGTKIFVGLLRVNASGTWINNAANSNITIRGGVTNSGTFTSGSGVYTFDTNNQDLNGTLSITNLTVTGITLTNNNTLTVVTVLAGTGTLAQAAAATLNIGNGITISTLQATNAGNTVNYSRNGNQTVLATSYYHLTLSTGGNKTAAGALTVAGIFTISAGATFQGGTFTHSLTGNFTNNGTFTMQTSTMAFNGTIASQTIGGSVATTFYALTINNSNGVLLNDGTNSTTKTVTNTLTLSSGYLTSDAANLIILNSGATASVANAAIEAGGAVLVPQHNSPFVNGPMRKIGNQAFVFPVGVTSTGCVPIGISAPALATDAFDAQYNRSSAGGLGTITSANLYNVSICEYWTLNRTTGASTISVTGYWNENSPCNGEAAGQYVNDLTTISLAHFNGTNWDNNSTSVNSSTVGNTTSGGITWTGVSTFSPFALGNNTATKTNPLPILLDYFTAVKFNGYNQLSWKAECTSASNSFEAQRSYDGTEFLSIYTVNVTSASDCSQPFAYNDYDAESQNKIYYRIKTVDVSEIVNYSDIKLITNDAMAIDLIRVAPNPVQNDATLKVSATHSEKLELVILSLDGRELHRSSVQVQTGANTVNLHTSQLTKGMYIIKGIFAGGRTQTIKFIKD